MARHRKQPGTGTVLERTSKRNGTVYQIRWRVNGGPAKYETIGPDREEAERALARRLAEVNLGVYRERPEASFHEFASEWFANHKPRLRPATVVDYELTLERHLLPFFADYMLDQIGSELIERYVAEKVAEREEGEGPGLSNRSINKTLTRLEQVMSAAVRHGYVDRNPVEHVARLKVQKRTRPFLQLDQINPLLKAVAELDEELRRDAEARNRHWEARPRLPLIMTLLLAGLRISEALAMRWGDVDLLSNPSRLSVRRSVYRGEEGPVKTGEEGTVTLPPRLMRALLEHKEHSPFDSDDDLVFPTWRGRHDNPSNVRVRVLKPAIARANRRLELEDKSLIPKVTPHGLRYTFCSLLIAQGEDVATVAAQMRHSDPTTTLRIYTQVMKHTRSGVAERLEEALWGGDSAKEVASRSQNGSFAAGR